MANLLLAVAVAVLLLAWRRTSFQMPSHIRTALNSPFRIATLAGFAVVLLTLGYSIGDVLAGRTRVTKSPVQYATRLQGPDAHHHDLVDSERFWRQVVLQTLAGLTVGATLVVLSRLTTNAKPPVRAALPAERQSPPEA